MAHAKPLATLRTAAGLPSGLLAMWWLLASEIVIFGGLLVGYLLHRNGHPEWALEAANTNTFAGGLNTMILLTSSLTAVLAHQAAQTGNGPRAARFLWLTILGACGFLVVKSFEWTHEIQHGFVLTKSGFWSFYYCAAGLHALHVIAGSIAMGFVAWGAAKGKELQRVEYAGIYWHFVDLVWIFLFPLLYIAK